MDLPPERGPLIEVVFEFKWELVNTTDGRPPTDPEYKLLVGSLFEKVRGDYGVHETLPAAGVPDEFVPQIPQHRFRASTEGYPLLQVGPGLMTVNDSRQYRWSTFQPRVEAAVATLRQTYAGDLRPQSLLLRYINAIPWSSDTDDLVTVLANDFGVRLQYPDGLFAGQPVEQRPLTFLLESSHKVHEPQGVITVKFATAQVNGALHLLWDTSVLSAGPEVPQLGDLRPWLISAHAICRSWFFTLIDGRLEAAFRQ